MKKLLVMLLGAALSFGVITAQAQTPQTTSIEKNQKDLRKDVKKVRAERKQRNHAIAHGKLRAAKAKQKEVNIDRKDMNADKKELKIQGVKHPVDKAKDQVDKTNPPQ